MSKRGMLNRVSIKRALKARAERLERQRIDLALMKMRSTMILAQIENMRSLRELPPMVLYDA